MPLHVAHWNEGGSRHRDGAGASHGQHGDPTSNAILARSSDHKASTCPPSPSSSPRLVYKTHRTFVISIASRRDGRVCRNVVDGSSASRRERKSEKYARDRPEHARSSCTPREHAARRADSRDRSSFPTISTYQHHCNASVRIDAGCLRRRGQTRCTRLGQ